jgi:hypothetical protein
MKLPTVSPASFRSFIGAKRLGEMPTCEVNEHESIEISNELIENFLETLEVAMAKADGLKKKNGKPEGLEGQHAAFELAMLAPTVEFFNSIPDEAIFEPGFWCFLGYRAYPVIAWRHPGNSGLENFGVISARLIESLLMRIYLRGVIGGEPEARAVMSQDFWRSHVLRVKLGQSKVTARAFAAAVARDGIKIDDQRAIARRLNGLRSNVVFELLTQQQAESVVELGRRPIS